MAKVMFRAKVRDVYNMDDTLAWKVIPVPKIGRSHCDMNAFRSHPKFGSYANSDLFPRMLERALNDAGVSKAIRLDKIPPGVEVDTSGFLACVSIEL